MEKKRRIEEKKERAEEKKKRLEALKAKKIRELEVKKRKAEERLRLEKMKKELLINKKLSENDPRPYSQLRINFTCVNVKTLSDDYPCPGIWIGGSVQHIMDTTGYEAGMYRCSTVDQPDIYNAVNLTDAYINLIYYNTHRVYLRYSNRPMLYYGLGVSYVEMEDLTSGAIYSRWSPQCLVGLDFGWDGLSFRFTCKQYFNDKGESTVGGLFEIQVPVWYVLVAAIYV